ncbi:chitinase [Catopsilia pomona nucleopolyhedrovirus]|uniref:Chitinase n=1 Tax=Catopsilia pomona nucleopolyhedrovirus TaxID=1850906 RepID=A0A172WZJ5_9ABAC|nr:chitinase [Catopsilia pomona nucleopolyhedrovirus]ANF29762.1 chitinase [Catopsilia pomona nucleopolyhedrovirus]
MFCRRSSLLLVCAAIVAIVAAMPGKPQIEWANRNYALVDVNVEAVSYENLVSIKNAVQIDIAWNVWSGGAGDVAYVLFNDKQVWKGDASDKRASINYTKSGHFDATVKLCDDEGCLQSDKIAIKIADTDGGHLQPLPYKWRENNEPGRRTDKTIAAYFVEWGVYGRNFPVDKVPLPNLSHLLYGFIPICGGDGINDALKTIPGSFDALQRSCRGRDDFKVSIHDIWAAVQKPQKGVTAWNEPYKGNFGQLMAAKLANPHVKILPSIGGWTLSDPFYFMHDSAKRATFVESVREFLQVWKFFDGVDIDWEFPGGKGANPSLGDATRDSKTYIALLKELRAMLDDLQTATNKTYELTSAISAGYDKIDVVDYASAQQYLDKIFLMTYDFKGAWSNTDLGYHTTVYAPTWNPNELYTTDVAVKELFKQKVSPKKIIIGVAMYGRGWTGVVHADDANPFLGIASGPVEGTWENGVVDYRQIKNTIDKYTYTFDDWAKAAYVYDKNKGDLIVFDSVDSVAAKVKYVDDHNLGGLFAWEIDADNGDLLNVMNTKWSDVHDEL